MERTKVFLAFTCILLAACTDKYEQQYQTYSEFDKVNQRNKGWFPNIISVDAHNLKNTSYLDSLCAFGTFSYSNNYFYDSIFDKNGKNKIDFSKFEQKLNEHIKRRPDWFLKTDTIAESDYEAIQEDRFYIARHLKDKKVYFILSN